MTSSTQEDAICLKGSLTSIRNTYLKSSDSHKAVASQCGLTAWRVLSGRPHYNLVEDERTQSLKVHATHVKIIWIVCAL